jgi:hypothetical protein
MSISRSRALAAPFAEFGDEEADPTLELKGGALLERLVGTARDGTGKRTAFLLTVLSLERNGRAGPRRTSGRTVRRSDASPRGNSRSSRS